MKKIVFFALMLGAVVFASCNKGNEPTPADTGGSEPLVVEGSLSGEFSVNNCDNVYFSQGNLQYCPATKTYRFAENQYDYIGDNNKYATDTAYTGWTDLLHWNPDEWENRPIQNGGNEAGLWRTPTDEDWQWIFLVRTNAKNLYGTGKVCGVNGMILLPDNWSAPAGITFTPGVGGWDQNVYDADQWAEMEAAGAVILPAAGYLNEVGACLVQSTGYYWTGVTDIAYEWQTYRCYFDDEQLFEQVRCDKDAYFSVRMVRNTK